MSLIVTKKISLKGQREKPHSCNHIYLSVGWYAWHGHYMMGRDWHHVNENKTEKVTVWRLETVTAWRMCVGGDAKMRVR